MLIIHVHIHAKPEAVEAMKAACLENARQSVQEPGIARFDVIQREDEPTRFVLMEAYRDEEAISKHKETAHYQQWRDTVADLMAESRYSVKYNNLFQDDAGW